MTKLDKFFGNKKNSSIIYLLLAMGILFMIFGNVGKSQPSESETASMSRSREAELILSEIKGVGEVRVMISEDTEEDDSLFSDKKTDKNDISVLIVADGGDGGHIREKIIKAAAAALGVDPHKIQVFERKD